jgi:DNA primase
MRTKRTRIDVQTIKDSIDLVAVVRRYTALRKVSRSGEYAGPCPRCGGMDRFHVKGTRFYCRQCYPRGGDVIDFVMLVENLSFQDACGVLTGNPSFIERKVETSVPCRAPHEPSNDWKKEKFKSSAHRTIRATQNVLYTEQGSMGQDYLRKRGLAKETWQTYRLGFGSTFHPARRTQQEAIFIPWYTSDGKYITAIQHRFIDPSLAKHERYSLKAGSSPLIFGLHALTPGETLVIVEGEFNCMAIHQVGYEALSIGSESNRTSRHRLAGLCDVLSSYEQALIWFDTPEYAMQLAAQLNANVSGEKQITIIDETGLDANELLITGGLSDVLRMLR